MGQGKRDTANGRVSPLRALSTAHPVYVCIYVGYGTGHQCMIGADCGEKREKDYVEKGDDI